LSFKHFIPKRTLLLSPLVFFFLKSFVRRANAFLPKIHAFFFFLLFSVLQISPYLINYSKTVYLFKEVKPRTIFAALSGLQ